MENMKFCSELDKYIVLKLSLDNYKYMPHSLEKGFEIAGAEIKPKIRKDEKRMLKSYFQNWTAPFYGNLKGWRKNSPIYLLKHGYLVGGLYVCGRNEFDDDEQWGQLHYFFVDPKFRGKGYHNLLFSEGVRRAQSWGLQGVYINTDRYGLPKVYKRWGAVFWKEIPKSSLCHKHPNLGHHNWLVYKIMDKAIGEAVRKYAKGKLLDIGCGEKPYENMTKPYITEHVGLDHENSIPNKSKVDLFGNAYNILVENEYFDTILCTAVLEHLEEPHKAIMETNRVLKTGGYCIYTVPLFWHLHEEPRDFYRFTKYGLKYLFEKNGFEIVELKPLSGFWVTFGQLFVYYLRRFRSRRKINPLWWLIPPIGVVIQGIAYMLDHLDKAEQWTWMYIVIAKKK